MATESTPPPSSGSGAKYTIVGVLLLLIGGGLIYFLTRPAPPAPTVAVKDAGVVQRQPPALADTEMFIPEPEPDAGPPPDSGPVKTKVVYRYVDGDWGCSGDIPAAEARRVIDEQRAQVRSCYERRLKVNHTLQGNLQVQVKVGANGSVQAVRVGGSLRDNEVFGCVRQLAGAWRFPAPSGGACAVVSAPFALAPRP